MSTVLCLVVWIRGAVCGACAAGIVGLYLFKIKQSWIKHVEYKTSTCTAYGSSYVPRIRQVRFQATVSQPADRRDLRSSEVDIRQGEVVALVCEVFGADDEPDVLVQDPPQRHLGGCGVMRRSSAHWIACHKQRLFGVFDSILVRGCSGAVACTTIPRASHARLSSSS